MPQDSPCSGESRSLAAQGSVGGSESSRSCVRFRPVPQRHPLAAILRDVRKLRDWMVEQSEFEPPVPIDSAEDRDVTQLSHFPLTLNLAAERDRRTREKCRDTARLNKPVVLAGDYNVIPTELDVSRRSVGSMMPCSGPSRATRSPDYSRACGPRSRRMHPEERIYTFWDFFRNHFERASSRRGRCRRWRFLTVNLGDRENVVAQGKGFLCTA